MSKKRQPWSKDQWVQFGNRVKAVRRELQNLGLELQETANVTECRRLFRVVDALDKAKCKLENLPAEQHPTWGDVTRVFYGEPETQE